MEIRTMDDWSTVSFTFKNQILGLQSPKARRDLNKILDGIYDLVNNLSKEEVECRRLHKQTAKHQELIAKINERIEFLEQMITFGALAT